MDLPIIITIGAAITEEEVAVIHVTTNVDLATVEEEEVMVVDTGTFNKILNIRDQEIVDLEDIEV